MARHARGHVDVALAAADTYVVVLALPDMMKGVGLGIDALQKATPIISGFLLGYIAVLPLIGRLSDVVSRRRVLLWGALGIGVFSLMAPLLLSGGKTGVSAYMILGFLVLGISFGLSSGAVASKPLVTRI